MLFGCFLNVIVTGLLIANSVNVGGYCEKVLNRLTYCGLYNSEFADDVGKIINVTTLEFVNNFSLEKLGGYRKLENLVLKREYGYRSCSLYDLWKHSRFKKLVVDRCYSLEDLGALKECVRLEKLVVRKCDMLVDIGVLGCWGSVGD